MKKHDAVSNLYLKKEKFLQYYTKSIVPGKKFFDEVVLKSKGEEYRQFDARRSKLAAALQKKAKGIRLKEGMSVLYLGASHGYTCSFLSDIIGKKGIIFGLDFAPRVVRDLVFVSQVRKNIVPILGDAQQPGTYASCVYPTDIVFQDVAQKQQAEIFMRNCDLFLKKNGVGILAVKSRSIDITRKPHKIYQEIRHKLEKSLEIIDIKKLDPLEKDHAVFVVRKK